MALHQPHATIIAIAVAIVTFIIHRRFFHRLSAVPGPWINCISMMPFSLQVIQGRSNVYLYELHAKYGPVVRIAPNEVSFASSVLETVYGLRKGGATLEKSRTWLGMVSPWKGFHGLGIARGEEHRRQRRALAPGVSKSALKSQETIIQTHVGRLMQRLRVESRDGQEVNMADWWSYFTFDMIGDVCFNQSFGCLDLGARTDWADSIIYLHISSSYITIIQQLAGMGTRLGRWLSKVLVKLLVPRKIDECRRVHFQKTLEATERRMGEDSSHPDVIWHVLQSNKDDLVLAPREEIILNMALFLSAGSETTSILLTALSWLIASHTDVRERLVHEIRFKFRSSGEVTLDTVTDSHLPYLNATINEAFRLFPPAGLAAAREIPAPGETIDGYALPEGTAVRVAGWALARSGSYFHKPNEFHPERWLSPPPKEFEDDRLEVSRPFIVGPRHCLGAPLAIFETQLAMTRLLLEFDVSLPTASPHTEGRGKWSLDPSTREFMSYSVIKKPDTWLSLRPVTRTE